MRRIRPKPNANHLNFTQNPHRLALEEKRISPNEIGVKVAHLGCGHTHGGGAPLVACLGPNLVRAVSYGHGKSIQVGMVVTLMLRRWFAPSIWEWGIFQRTPSPPPINGGPLLFIDNNTQGEEQRARARERAPL